MPSVCIYFQVHQPYRLRRYSFFDIGSVHVYDDEEGNRRVLNKVADKCYLPTNALLLSLIKEYGGYFRIAFSLTGVILEQMEKYRPDVLESFQKLAGTGCVEFLSETYYHSLAFLFAPREFREQVKLHGKKIRELFGRRPVTFRNTELIYSNELAKVIEGMGYKAILAEGADKILGWRSPNFVYRPAGCARINLLLKNYRLSDDIAFRFSDSQWCEHPLTAGKFPSRPPSEGVRDSKPVAELETPQPISWADTERDLTAWLGNAMQQDASRALHELEDQVRRKK